MTSLVRRLLWQDLEYEFALAAHRWRAQGSTPVQLHLDLRTDVGADVAAALQTCWPGDRRLRAVDGALKVVVGHEVAARALGERRAAATVGSWRTGRKVWVEPREVASIARLLEAGLPRPWLFVVVCKPGTLLEARPMRLHPDALYLPVWPELPYDCW
jgi:hypothetical protein